MNIAFADAATEAARHELVAAGVITHLSNGLGNSTSSSRTRGSLLAVLLNLSIASEERKDRLVAADGLVHSLCTCLGTDIHLHVIHRAAALVVSLAIESGRSSNPPHDTSASTHPVAATTTTTAAAAAAAAATATATTTTTASDPVTAAASASGHATAVETPGRRCLARRGVLAEKGVHGSLIDLLFGKQNPQIMLSVMHALTALIEGWWPLFSTLLRSLAPVQANSTRNMCGNSGVYRAYFLALLLKPCVAKGDRCLAS
jgi:hypothetical protein